MQMLSVFIFYLLKQDKIAVIVCLNRINVYNVQLYVCVYIKHIIIMHTINT